MVIANNDALIARLSVVNVAKESQMLWASVPLKPFDAPSTLSDKAERFRFQYVDGAEITWYIKDGYSMQCIELGYLDKGGDDVQFAVLPNTDWRYDNLGPTLAVVVDTLIDNIALKVRR